MNKNPKKISLFLAKPDKTIIGKLGDSFNRKLNIKFTELNELSLTLPYLVERNHKLVRHPHIDKVKEKFLIKAVYGDIVEWFLIYKKAKSANEADSLNIDCFSLGYELHYKKIRGYDVKAYNCYQVTTDCLEGTNWKIGYINPEFNLKNRKFDISNSSRLDFLYKIAETFEGIVTFDTENRLVNIWKEEELSTYKGFWISYGKYLQTIEEVTDVNDVITRLHVRGSDDLTIASVNPTGELFIDDFSYFMYPFEIDSTGKIIKSSENGMSDSLCLALTSYNYKVSNNKTSFSELLAKKSEKQQVLSTENNKLTTLNGELKIILDNIQVAKTNGTSTTELNKKSTSKQAEIKTQKEKISNIEKEIASIDSTITSLKSDLKLENNLTEAQAKELIQFTHEEDWSDDNHIDENDLYEAAIVEMKKKNSPPINISLGIVNFLDVIEEQRNWDKLNIGDIIKIKHDPLNIFVEAKIVEISFDFESGSINLSISNTKKVKSLEDGLKEFFYTVKKNDTDYNVRKEDWMKTAVNFNARNDRIKDKPTNPTLISGSSVSHIENDNGSVNLTLSWTYPDSKETKKDADNIDGFYVYMYSSSSSDPYIFGSSMVKETKVPLNFDSRSYTFPNVTPNYYYTLGVRAYRYVDEDIHSEGILLSDIIAEENPYLPNPVVNLKGRINGSNYTVTPVLPENPIANDVNLSTVDAKTRIYDGETWKVADHGEDAKDYVDTVVNESGEKLKQEIEEAVKDTYVPKQDTPPDPNVYKLWWDTTSNPARFMQYDTTTGSWKPVAPTEEEINKLIADTEASIQNNIVTTINVSPEAIKIATNKLSVEGIVAFINSDGTTGTLIDGKKLITGSVTANQLNVNEIFANTAVVGKIQAGIIKTAELDAAQIMVGTLKGIDIQGVTITGSTLLSQLNTQNYTKIEGATLESRGTYSRSWSGLPPSTHDIKLRFENGYLRARNDSENRSLYFSDFGISTTTDGINASGTLEFFSKENSPLGRGVTLTSAGVTTIRATGGAVYLDSSTTINATKPCYLPSVITPSLNGYFGVDGELRVTSKGYAEFTDSNLIFRNVHANGYIGQFLQAETGLNAYVGTDLELRVTARSLDNSGSPIYRNIRANGLIAGTIASSSGNIYVGTDDEVRITSRGGYNGGETIYRNLRANGILTNAVDIHSGTHLYLRAASGGEVRVTTPNSTSDYASFRCDTIYRSSEVATSRREMKKNITDYTVDALSEINTTPIREYHLLGDSDTEKKRLGVIMDEAPVDIVDIKGNGVETYAMISMSWKAIQELSVLVNQLRQEVNELKGI
jgi:hypothetical protein